MSLTRTRIALAAGLLILGASVEPSTGALGEDFAFLEPWFRPTRGETDTLTGRGVVVRALPAADRQIAILAVCGVNLTPDAFLERIQRGWDAGRGAAIGGRLGSPPSRSELATLVLDEGDIDRLRRCRTGDCRLNLGHGEIESVRAALAKPGPAASIAVQDVFRDVILDRVRRYQQGGLPSLPDYQDRSRPVKPAVIFNEILAQSAWLRQRLPRVEAYLRQFTSTDVTPESSFLHWSKVMMNGKAVVRVSHVSTFRPGRDPQLPVVLLTGKQVYASRYMNGELTLTMLFATGAGHYLVHLDRSELDELGGMFSGLKRSVMEGRIKDEATGALAALRDRLERHVSARPPLPAP